MVVVFIHDAIRREHEKHYNQNIAYREQYDLLHNSVETYNVAFGPVTGYAMGRFNYNGKSFDITLEQSGTQSLITRLSHEFQHGVQFEKGELGFFSRNNGKDWEAFNYDITDETNAWDASLKIAPLTDYVDINSGGFSSLGKYSHLKSQSQKEAFLRNLGYDGRKNGPLNNLNINGNELYQVINHKGWQIKYNLWSK